jgi:hypothetical protein
MPDYAPRCPFCANVLKVQHSFWERIGLRPAKARCPTCHRSCEAVDAETMGSAYGHWADIFRKELTAMLEGLPILEEAAMYRALGTPLRDDTRSISSVEDLIRACTRQHRAVLVEMARGREATLEVVHLMDSGNKPEVVAILGTSAPESASREQEQLIARSGMHHYVLFTYPSSAGAEPRVKRAVHTKAPRSLTEAHVMAMHAEPHATHHR